ncbi:MAG: amidohydrolase family protein [Kiritimatiellia bacterium]
MKILIKNGIVIDGTGKPAFPADVLVEDDRIIDIIPRPSNNSTPCPLSNASTVQLANSFTRQPANPPIGQFVDSSTGSLTSSSTAPLTHTPTSPLSNDGSTGQPANTPTTPLANSSTGSLAPSPTNPFAFSSPRQPVDSPIALDLGGVVDIIDATGCFVTPGFIDAHAHSDAYLVLEPDAPSKLTQGVTTEINGQCGGSIAPRYGEARLSSDWASLLGDRLTWRSLAEYRAVLAAAKPAVNTVQFVGHNTLRSSVVGYAPRAASDDELRRMSRLLEQALDEGGWGLTTGLIYQPGKYSTPEEVVALAKVAAAKGGYYATHMRSEGDRILEAIDEVVGLVRATGIRAEISHLKTSGPQNWHKLDAVLDKIEHAMADGLLLGSDRYPYCAAGTDLDVVLPDWAQVGAAKGEMERLADSQQRARIIDEINASDRDWASVMIGGTWSPENRCFSGQTIAAILGYSAPNASRSSELASGLSGGQRNALSCPPHSAPGTPHSAFSPPPLAPSTSRSRTPGELVCEILLRDGCKTGAFFFGMSEENLAKIYSRPWIVPGSDASLRAPWGPLGADHPHPRAYATMPEFYRRVRALGCSREETVARMTSVVADRFSIRGRGRIEKGAYADLVVWREAEFKAKATFNAPHQFTEGVKCVMVNGVIPYQDGRFTGKRGGRFLER